MIDWNATNELVNSKELMKDIKDLLVHASAEQKYLLEPALHEIEDLVESGNADVVLADFYAFVCGRTFGWIELEQDSA